jgi:hypothetical protein
LNFALALHPEKIRLAREAPSAKGVRASLRALFAAGLAQVEIPDATVVEAALARVKATTIADLPDAKGASEPTDRYEDTVFEIDAQLIVPAHGYGLTAVRRFLIAFGRRRHTNSVSLAVLFGRAARASAPAVPSERRGV